MKIEKVNENQIRCILTKEELADRQIKLSELAYGSEKAKGLFRDMIEQANNEFGFEADDIPLMIEAIPLMGEHIVLQITKVEYPEELDTRFSRFSASEEDDDATMAEDDMFSDMQGADDVLGIFQKMKDGLEKAASEKETPKSVEKKEIPVNLTKMFEFYNLDQIQRLAEILGGYYKGESDIYKDEKKHRYYLLVRKSNHTPEEFNKVCNIISEYASYKKYTSAREAFLKEHGKRILTGNALQVLNEISG